MYDGPQESLLLQWRSDSLSSSRISTTTFAANCWTSGEIRPLWITKGSKVSQDYVGEKMLGFYLIHGIFFFVNVVLCQGGDN